MQDSKTFKRALLYQYLITLFRREKFRGVLAIILLVVVGITEGVGLLMLIPFLQLIGIGDSTPEGITAYIGKIWRYFGLPLNLTTVLIVYGCVVSIYALLQRCSTILNSKISHAFTRSLRNDLFASMARVKWLEFTKIKASDVNHIMTVNLTAVDNGTYSLFVLISAIFVVAVHVGVAFTLSVPLTAVALASSAVLLVILRPLNKKSYMLGEDWRSTMSALYGVLMEHLGGMKLAKSFGAEDQHIEGFDHLSRGLENQANRYAGILASTQMYHEIGAVAVLGVFFYVAVQVLAMPAAKLLIIVFLFGKLVPQFSWMQRVWQQILNMMPAYGAAVELLQRFRDSEEWTPPKKVEQIKLRNAVDFQDVYFKYDKSDQSQILDGFTLRVPAFETTVILGPSGGGKSTFADLLIGLLQPDKGQILIDGKALRGDTVYAWRKSVAYVPQESLLFHDTLRNNMLWARPDATEEDIWAALKLASADAFIAKIPEGLDVTVGDRGIRLSGGERQRIALARALLRNPTLLLLDEATSSLDQKNEQRILNALEGLRGTMTVVFISHRLSAAACADRIAVIDRGRVVETGSVNDLKDNPQSRFQQLIASDKLKN